MMDTKSLAILRSLKPASREDVAQMVKARTKSGSREELSLADAGVEDEVHEFMKEDSEPMLMEHFDY